MNFSSEVSSKIIEKSIFVSYWAASGLIENRYVPAIFAQQINLIYIVQKKKIKNSEHMSLCKSLRFYPIMKTKDYQMFPSLPGILNVEKEA